MRLILTDVDSVILDYAMTDEWVDLTEDQHDERIENGLPIFRDANYGLHYLHNEHGYKFHAITTVGRKHQLARESNLYSHFDPIWFKQIDCLDYAECKSNVLMPYKGTGLFWLEDSITNAKIGQDLGLQSVVMNTPWNIEKDFNGPRVNNWIEFIDIVEGKR